MARYASWTPELIQRLRDLADTGSRRREIAVAMGLSFKQIASAGKRYGIKFFGKAEQRPASQPNWRRYYPRKSVPAEVAAPVDEAEAIARHIAERGVTRCPPAFAGIVQSAIPDDEARRRIKKLKLTEPRRPSETAARYYQRIGGTAAVLR